MGLMPPGGPGGDSPSCHHIVAPRRVSYDQPAWRSAEREMVVYTSLLGTLICTDFNVNVNVF